MGQNDSPTNKLVVIGNIGAPFGVQGWVKINSYTEPKENIFHFENWLLTDDESGSSHQQIATSSIVKTKKSKDQFLVLFANVQDRNLASLLTNKKIAINRNELPILPTNQYYWEDLINCNVYNLSGESLGMVDYLFSTSSNDIMVVKNSINNVEYLIPYSFGDIVTNVNLSKQIITVNWDLS